MYYHIMINTHVSVRHVEGNFTSPDNTNSCRIWIRGAAAVLAMNVHWHEHSPVLTVCLNRILKLVGEYLLPTAHSHTPLESPASAQLAQLGCESLGRRITESLHQTTRVCVHARAASCHRGACAQLIEMIDSATCLALVPIRPEVPTRHAPRKSNKKTKTNSTGSEEEKGRGVRFRNVWDIRFGYANSGWSRGFPLLLEIPLSEAKVVRPKSS